MSADIVEPIAQAIAEAFWRTAEQPRAWSAHSPQHKQVWRQCAQAALEAGRQLRKQREAA